MEFDLGTTLIMFFAAVLACILSGYLGARPPNLKTDAVRLVPYRLIMLLSGTAAIILLVHIFALVGGNPQPAFTPY
ncbi:hypothetical protein Q1W73_07630 [Asticcacaulis sp. ZE23SCel15]|uniref:hypothetical protein n=1 Tax=Asticcacaulis sp. ZE23SCel15 TaxID=3059027 RepID=UPI002660000B|nr:hypothetical protein [Asticcacaulis sp. ZE23SCel15]WKL58847.1 hypothetical protein Q1W73_07630 [Asticcacaulis sp. ZE23SCel15]